MATDKRSRQRENRAAKQAEAAAIARKERLIRRVRQISVWTVIIIGTFVLANLVWGGG